MKLSQFCLLVLTFFISSFAYAMDGGGAGMVLGTGGGLFGIIAIIFYGIIFIMGLSFICLMIAIVFYFQSKSNSPVITPSKKNDVAIFFHRLIFIGMFLSCLGCIFFLPSLLFSSYMWNEILFVPLGIVSVVFWIASYVFTISQFDKKFI